MTSIHLLVLSIAVPNGRRYKANMLDRSLTPHGTNRAIKTTEMSYFKPNLIRIMQNRLAVARVMLLVHLQDQSCVNVPWWSSIENGQSGLFSSGNL